MLTDFPNYGTRIVFPPRDVVREWQQISPSVVEHEIVARGDNIEGAFDAVIRAVTALGGSSHSDWIDENFNRPANSPQTALIVHATVMPNATDDDELLAASVRLGAPTILIFEKMPQGWRGRWLP